MSLLITRAGLQTTVQATARTGQRHLGVPSCGPADSLSMALANRLVGNALLAPALEVTLTGVALMFQSDTAFAITGAPADSTLNNAEIGFHRRLRARAGDELHIGHAKSGSRSYVATAGGIQADLFLRSASTYLPAGLGGYKGRALLENDQLTLLAVSQDQAELETPAEFRPPITHSWALRACHGAEFPALSAADQKRLFDTNFVVGTRNDRMGMQLQADPFDVSSAGYLASVPIFPGCVQCPEDGTPYLLSVDAQTTGGYPRVAQVIRADRHLIGQLRPGDHVRLLRRTPAEAHAELQEKLAYWRQWLPDVESVI